MVKRKILAKGRVSTQPKETKTKIPTRTLRTKKTVPTVTEVVSSKKQISWKTILKHRNFIIALVILILAGLIITFGQRIVFVAYVNGTPITRAEYYKALEMKDGPAVMQNLVIESLINQEAAKKGIRVTPSDIQNSEKKIENQLSAQGQSLDGVLSQQGMTKAQFEDQLKIQQEVEKLLGDKVSITDKQIDDYIVQNKDSLPTNATGSALRAQVKQQLEQQELTLQFQSFIASLQKSAHITYLVNLK